jgi:hypothetical protein
MPTSLWRAFCSWTERRTCSLSISCGQEHFMSLSRRAILISLAGLHAFGGSPAFAGSGVPEGLDTDADGTVDLAEAKKAAETLFDKLDHDHDDPLDAKELRRRLTKGVLTAADLDKDGTLSKDEYLAVV